MEYQARCTAVVLCLVLAAVVSTMTMAATKTLINGPTAVAPLSAIVTFTCVVNTTELPVGTFQSMSWIVDGMVLSGNIDQETTNGSLVISYQCYKTTSLVYQFSVRLL